MNYQTMLQQLEEDQRWSHDRAGRNSLADDGAGPFRSSGRGGGGGGGYRDAALSTSNTATRSGLGGSLTLFSPSELLLSSQGNEPAPSPFGWQSLFCGRWQPDAAFGGDQSETSEANAAAACGERKRNGTRLQCHVVEDDDMISEVDAGRNGEVKQDWTNNVNSEENYWSKFGGYMDGDVKQEEIEYNQEAGDHRHRDGFQSRKRYRQSELQGHPDVVVNFEPSGSTSQSDFDSEESGKQHNKEALIRKQKRPGQDADGNITWTDDSVGFLFHTYDAIHQRLWEESKGRVKYQKKWTPILKAMRARFGNHFTKKQCQSKYWSVRRECTEYRNTSVKAAATDPLWNPSIAGRELLKPKFYDVWLAVEGKYQAIASKTKSSEVERVGYTGELLKGESSRSPFKDGQLPAKQRTKDSNVSAMKEMQKLMIEQLQASEKMEEAMKCRADLMMELLTQHIVHVENRVATIHDSRTPQLYMLERVNHKLERILEGFAALNQSLSMLH